MYDLLDLLEDKMRPAYAGHAPLGFTGRYFTPDELLAARAELARVRVGRPKDYPTFGTWRLGITTGWCGIAPGHRLCILPIAGGTTSEPERLTSSSPGTTTPGPAGATSPSSPPSSAERWAPVR